MDPQTNTQNAYTEGFSNLYLPEEILEVFNLTLDDDKLEKMLIQSLDKNVDYWNQKPWVLEKTDKENTNFLLGDQLSDEQLSASMDNEGDIDNRLFSSTRAILSYATGQLAKPEITPSKSDDENLRMARAIQDALYQHSADEHVDQKTRAAVLNLISRKRGYLKLRFDPNLGIYGDITTEVCNPEDIIIDRNAGFMQNPNAIYHRVRCSLDELVSRFPKKADEIYTLFSVKRGTYSQMSKYITYFECWFTYMDNKNKPREGVAWFLHDPSPFILDKMPNPNWVYTGDDQKDKETNVLFMPPKPFVGFNYLATGHSYIDETCLFEQARPLQRMLNQRVKQFNDNVDLMNGRWVFSKEAFSQEDATKFVNKGSKSIALVTSDDVNKAADVLSPNVMPAEVFNSILDFRNEIDTAMGTPSIFRGQQPESQDTLGRDMMVKQQAGMLQDDLVRAVNIGMEQYYQIKLQMFRVYYTEDYWFQVKGGDGKFDFVMLNGDSIDSNVKIGVQIDSTLPVDKPSIRATAMQLWEQGQAIDYESLMKDLGLPDPELRTERYLRSKIDPIGYLHSITEQIDNNDAEVDIMLLKAGKEPQERDNYDADYLNYFNNYLTTNGFQILPQPTKLLLTNFLQSVTQRAERTASLQESTLDDAGITTAPLTPPLPVRTVRENLAGTLSPQDSEQAAGIQQPPQSPLPQAQQTIQQGPPTK